MDPEAKLLPDADALAQPPAHASGAGVRDQCVAIEKTRQRLRLEQKRADSDDDDDAKGEAVVDDEDRAPFPDVLRAASEFYDSRDFTDTIDRFAREHASAFADASADARGEEQSLERTSLHEQYLELFEAELSAFARAQGVDQREFFLQCRDALEDRREQRARISRRGCERARAAAALRCMIHNAHAPPPPALAPPRVPPRRYCALFEEHEHHSFVEALLAAFEYDEFVRVMVSRAREQRSRGPHK